MVISLQNFHEQPSLMSCFMLYVGSFCRVGVSPQVLAWTGAVAAEGGPGPGREGAGPPPVVSVVHVSKEPLGGVALWRAPGKIP